MKAVAALKPQDILVLLKLIVAKDRLLRVVDVAQELSLSPSEVSVSLERSKRSGLINISKKKVVWPALLEFLVHGIRYVYPAAPGPVCRGVPTAHSAPPLAQQIMSNEDDQYVWPSGSGTVRGQAIEPIYESVPVAAGRDPALYELLALVDALRVGRAREREIAREELSRRLHA